MEPPSQVPTARKRGASFSVLEQTCLTNSWIETSMDPIHGNDQRGVDFYRKVSELFIIKMGEDYTLCSPESLHAHWRDTIQVNVAKFPSVYAKATSKAISGYNSDDYLRDAQLLYVSEHKSKKSLKLMHCWEILRNHSKWCTPTNSSQIPTLIEGRVGPILDRPIGCHLAKKAKVDAKSKAKDIIEGTITNRHTMASKSFNMIEKSNALKELMFFKTDTSEEGKIISKQLRANYVAKYVTLQQTSVDTTEFNNDLVTPKKLLDTNTNSTIGSNTSSKSTATTISVDLTNDVLPAIEVHEEEVEEVNDVISDIMVE